MNENNAVTGNLWTSLLSGLSSGDKGFVFLLLSMIGAYGVKRYFDNVDKAMDHGYNTTLKADKYGEMRFTRGVDDEPEEGLDETDKSPQDDAQETDPETDQNAEPGAGV